MDAQTPQPSATQPLDRTLRPDVPDAVVRLWDGWDYNGGTDTQALTDALKGLTTVVNALTGGEQTYAVGLATQGVGQTDTRGRRTQITSAALLDARLTLDERLAVTTAIGMHEAGHARLSQPMGAAVKAHFGSWDSRAHLLSNILDDVRLEARTVEDYPAFSGAFLLGAWWVSQRYPSGGILDTPITRGQAVSLGLAAVRYDPFTLWTPDPDVQTERRWWQDWAERGVRDDSPATHVAAVAEALAHIEHLPEDAPGAGDPEPGEPGEPGEGTQGTPAPSAGKAEDDDGAEAEGAEADAGQADADAEADAEADGAEGDSAGTPGEADGDADADADADGEGEAGAYTRTDLTDSGPADAAEAMGGDGPIGYGASDKGDYRPDAETPEPSAERNALDAPLPLHAEDAATNDDRNRDMAVSLKIAQTAQMESRTTVRVTHMGEASRTVGIQPIDERGWGAGRAVTDPSVQGALRAAFTARRTSHDDRNVARSGRISGSRAYRVRAGFDNVFTRRDALSPDRLDVHFLIDASGSMAQRMRLANSMAANLTEALAYLPTVRVHVWGHNDAYGTVLYDLHDSRKGGDAAKEIGRLYSASANNDASAILAVTERILAERNSRERSILVVLSDGAPCEDEAWVMSAVQRARDKGIGVVSVAVAGGLTATQEACYGPMSVVPWTGDWDALGRGMAQIIGRLA